MKKLIISLFVVGCTACASLRPHGAAQARQSDETVVTVKGRVVLEGDAKAGTSPVTVFEVGPKGELLTLARTVQSVADDGQFNIVAPLLAQDPTPTDGAVLVIQIGLGDSARSVAVPTSMEIDKAVYALPIDTATTIRTRVYLAARAAGAWPEAVSVVRLHGLVTDKLAALVQADPHNAETIDTLARASAAAAAAWHDTLAEPSIGFNRSRLARIDTAIDWAQLTLASGLDVAHNDNERAQANRTYNLGVPLLLSLADVTPADQELAAQATVEAYEAYLPALPAAVARQVRLDAEMWRAQYVDQLAQEAFYTTGKPTQREMIHRLGVALKAHIMDAGKLDPADTQSALHVAWADYAAAVRGHVHTVAQATHVDFATAQAGVQKDCDSAIAALASVKPDTAAPAAADKVALALSGTHATHQAEAAHLTPMMTDLLAALAVAAR